MSENKDCGMETSDCLSHRSLFSVKDLPRNKEVFVIRTEKLWEGEVLPLPLLGTRR